MGMETNPLFNSAVAPPAQGGPLAAPLVIGGVDSAPAPMQAWGASLPSGQVPNPLYSVALQSSPTGHVPNILYETAGTASSLDQLHLSPGNNAQGDDYA